MDREHVKGAAEKAKGSIKETAGKLTDDKELQSEGKLDKAKGDVHNAVGDVKDAARNLNKWSHFASKSPDAEAPPTKRGFVVGSPKYASSLQHKDPK